MKELVGLNGSEEELETIFESEYEEQEHDVGDIIELNVVKESGTNVYDEIYRKVEGVREGLSAGKKALQ